MSKIFTLRLTDEDEKQIEMLKDVYHEKTTSKLIKRLIKMHYRFWTNEVGTTFQKEVQYSKHCNECEFHTTKDEWGFCTKHNRYIGHDGACTTFMIDK